MNKIIELKDYINYIKKNGLYYRIDEKKSITKFKPWLGDDFSFLYDRIMEKSI